MFYTKHNIYSFIHKKNLLPCVFRTVSSRNHCIWTPIKPHLHKFQLISTSSSPGKVSLSVLLLNLFLWPLHILSLSVSLRPLPALFLTLVIFIPFTAPVSSCPPPTSPVTKQPILDAHWGILPQVGIWRGASLHGTACVSDPLQCNASSSAQLPSALSEH